MRKILAVLGLFFYFSIFLFAHTISIGDKVSMVADKVKVRSCADLSCSQNGLVDIHSIGSVVDGVEDEDGYYWWKVNWESGQPDGWTPTPKSGSSWYYEQPTLLSPGGRNKDYKTIQDKSPTLKWKRVDGVAKYRIALRDVETDELLVDRDIDGSLTSYTYAYTLEEGHRYYWDIVPRDKDGDMGIWADSLYFKIAKNDVKKPDLQVESQYIEIRPSSDIQAGDEFSIKLRRIYNRGNAKSDRYGIRFYYGGTSNNDSAFNRFDGDSYFQALDPGDYGKIVYSKKINTDNVGGTHYVKVCVYDNPNDSNHNNDCAITSFEVQGNEDDTVKPKIDSIIPNPIIASSSKQTITINGKNFNSSSRIKWKTSSGSSGIVSDGGTHYKSSVKIQVYIRVTSTSDTWYFKVVNSDGSESDWKSVKNKKNNSSASHKPIIIDGDTSVKGGKSGEKINFRFKAVDEDDLAQGETNYTLHVKWGDGQQEDFTKEYDKTVTISHIYNNNKTTTYDMRVYAIDSDGEQSYINKSVKIQGSNSSSVPIEKTSYNRKEVANDLCAKPRSVGNSVDKASGAENFSITPLKVNGLVSLPFTLQYNSLLLSSGDISKGWSYNYNISSRIVKIEENSLDVYRVYWDNSSKKYNDYIYDIENQYYKSKEKDVIDDTFIEKSDGTFILKKKSGTSYTYDRKGYISSIQNYKKQGLTIKFDDNGKLKKLIEPKSGVYLSYIYNDDGKLKEVKDNTGRKAYLYYNSDGLLSRVDYPDDTRHLFSYNETEQIDKYEIQASNGKKITHFKLEYKDDGKVLGEEDGRDTISWFFYDTDKKPNRIISTYRDKNHKEIKTEYDSINFNPYHIEYPDGTIENFEYYDNGKLKTKTNRAGHTTNYYYDSKGNLEKVHYSDGSEELYEYDDNRNITQKTIKDKNGKSYITINTYDSNNNLKSQTIKNPAGQDLVTTYTYNDNNQIETKTIDGKTTTYTYNTKGYLESVITEENVETTYTYDNAGRVKTQTTQQSGTTTYEYDNMDNIKTITNQAQKTKTFKYDFRGNKIEEKDFNENITKYKYDDNGNMILKTDALNNEWKFEYDSADRLYKAYDPIHKDKFVKYEYDSMGRLYKKTDKKGYTTTYTYDAMGNLKTQTDPYGHTLFTNTYDSHNNLVKTIDNLNHTTKTDYTVFAKPSQITDPKKRVTSFIYDDIGRLIEVINADGKSATQSYYKDGKLKEFTDSNGNKTTFTYNGDGQLLTTTTASGSKETNTYNQKGLLDTYTNGRNDTKTFTYDQLGRVKQAKDKDGTITYTYDDNSNLRTITENGKTATYTYDALNQVESYTNIYGETIYYDYDALGNLVRLTYPNGKVIEYSYDLNSNLKEVKDANQITTYEYDKNNHLVKLTRPNGTVLQRTYNDAGQLTSQTDKTKNGTIISSVTFDYDEVGNIKKEIRTPKVAPTKPINLTMTYQKGNLLKEANNTVGYFDKDDNLITLGSKTYTYDSRNRLTNFGNTSYTYDAQNHRVAQTTNNKTTKYTINPNAPLSQTLIIDNNGAKTTYVYGNGLLYQEKDGKKLYYHYDLRGSTIALTDENGNIVDRFSYLPYGELNSHDLGTTKTPFLYNGRDGVMSDENGLYYMRARYYDPTIRRFINRDTLLGDIGDMATLNRFGYVNGNPVIGVDPSGQILQMLIGAAVGFVVDGGLEIASQLIINGEINWGKVAKSAATGMALGAVTGGIGNVVKGARTLSKFSAVFSDGAGIINESYKYRQFVRKVHRGFYNGNNYIKFPKRPKTQLMKRAKQLARKRAYRLYKHRGVNIAKKTIIGTIKKISLDCVDEFFEPQGSIERLEQLYEIQKIIQKDF